MRNKISAPVPWRRSIEGWIDTLKAAGLSAQTIKSRRYKMAHLAALLMPSGPEDAATHDLFLVARLLGHASVETTQVYVAMPDTRLRAGFDAVLLGS